MGESDSPVRRRPSFGVSGDEFGVDADDSKPSGLFNQLWPDFPLLRTKLGAEPISKVVKDNFRSGATVALISLPLSAALGVASNVHPMMGIETSFWSGLVMAILGSSDLNIVGCSGALSGMMTSYTMQWGAEVAPWLALVSSGFLFLFYFLRVDKYVFHMPAAVFEGFSIAVAFIIGLNQLNFAFGLHPHEKHKHFYENVAESLSILDTAHPVSTIFFLLNTLILLGLLKYLPKLPWIPISAFVGCIIGWIFDPEVGPAKGSGVELYTLKTTYGFLEPQFFYPLKPFREVVPAGEEVSFILAGLFVCIVCALETVLSAQVASVRAGDYPFSEKQELGAVAVSNVVQGLTGTLPNTGLFLRTSANVMGGATHRMSNFLNVVILGVVAVAVGPQFSYLPQPSAAAILASGSVRMVPYSYLGRLWRVDRTRLALTAVVTLVSCFRDPVEGLICGIFIAYMANATNVVEGRGVCDVKKLKDESGFEITINGPLTYITGKQVERTMKKMQGAHTVVVRMKAVGMCDTDGVVALEHGLRHLTSGDDPAKVYFCSVRESVDRKMRSAHGLAKFEAIPEERRDLDLTMVRKRSKLSMELPAAEATVGGSEEPGSEEAQKAREEDKKARNVLSL